MKKAASQNRKTAYCYLVSVYGAVLKEVFQYLDCLLICDLPMGIQLAVAKEIDNAVFDRPAHGFSSV